MFSRGFEEISFKSFVKTLKCQPFEPCWFTYVLQIATISIKPGTYYGHGYQYIV